MATSTKSAGGGATSGTPVWSNPGNIVSSDNAYATISIIATDSYAYGLFAFNFGFAIPTGSTINGISVQIEGKADNSGQPMLLGRLGSWSGSAFTQKGGYKYCDYRFSETDTVRVLGSSSELWATTWTASDLNASTFGCEFILRNDLGGTFTSTVDYIEVTVTYTEAVGPAALKTVNGLAVASVKTLRSGLAIASGKTFNGLA
jgi:hypothetical protein